MLLTAQNNVFFLGNLDMVHFDWLLKFSYSYFVLFREWTIFEGERENEKVHRLRTYHFSVCFVVHNLHLRCVFCLSGRLFLHSPIWLPPVYHVYYQENDWIYIFIFWKAKFVRKDYCSICLRLSVFMSMNELQTFLLPIISSYSWPLLGSTPSLFLMFYSEGSCRNNLI